MSESTNALNWFEIPVTDTVRARSFYETILDVPMHSIDLEGMEMTMFPADLEGNGKVSGALVRSPYHIPSMQGSVVYLNANPFLDAVLERVETAGGEILTPRTFIDEQSGYFAFFIDTEGNRVGLHASY